jgi:hypothetical protein
MLYHSNRISSPIPLSFQFESIIDTTTFTTSTITTDKTSTRNQIIHEEDLIV